MGKPTREIVLTDSEILACGSSEIIPCGDSEIAAETAVVMERAARRARDSLECAGKPTREIVLTDSEILARGSSEIIPCGDSEITAVPAVVMGGGLKF